LCPILVGETAELVKAEFGCDASNRVVHRTGDGHAFGTSRYDGVAKYMGDGVLIYFGYPQAYEHNAERGGAGRVEPSTMKGPVGAHEELCTIAF
jgi:hypothetical protein